MKRRLRRMEWLGLLTWGLVMAIPAHAELPQVRLYAISPTGGRAGEELELTLTAGEDLEEINELRFSHPGIVARPKYITQDQVDVLIPNVFVVKIEEDVAPGLYEVSCAGLWGASNPRRFVVSGRNEIRDSKENETPQSAVPVPLECVINNTMRIPGDVDWYRFSGKQGQRIVLDCWAERIDSRLDAVLSIYDVSGRRRLSMSDNVKGDDPVLVFEVPADGDYLIKLHDLTYRHGAEFHYRLEVHTGPYVEFSDPPAGTSGTTAAIALFGYNLPGSERDPRQVRGVSLERLDVTIPIPGDNEAIQIENRVSPRAAGMDAFTYRLRTEHGVSNPVRIGRTDWPVVPEQEPNDDAQHAQTLAVPVDLSGTFDQRGDQDRYQLQLQSGEEYSIEVFAERIGSLADPVLTVERINPAGDGAGKTIPVTIQDDQGANFNSNYFETRTIDPSYRFTADESGLYRITLQDCYSESRGGPSLQYRLAIHRSAPDFRIVAVPGAPHLGQVWPVSLRRHDRFPITIYAYRRDGFDGAIRIEPESLPHGIECPAVVIGPKCHSSTMVVSSTADASPGIFSLSFRSVAEVTGSSSSGKPATIIHPVRMATTIWGYHGIFPAMCRLTDWCLLSILDETSPFELTTGVAEIHVDQGSILQLPIHLNRGPTCTETIKLLPQNLPDQVKSENANLVVSKEENECRVRLQVGDAAPPGTYTIWVQGDSEVSYRRNPAAAERLKQAHQQAKEAAEAAMQLAQTASKQKNEALRLQGLATRKLQQAQGTSTAQAQALDGARMESEKTSLALRQAGDVLAKAEEKLAMANQAFAEADANRQKAEKGFVPFDTAARQAERALQESRVQLQRLLKEAANIPDLDEPQSGDPSQVSVESNDSSIRIAREKVVECELKWHKADLARRDARPQLDAAIAALDAQTPIQSAAMAAHNQAFQLQEAARQKNAAQQQLLMKAEQAFRLAQQALMWAQEESTAADRGRIQAEADEKQARTAADDAENRRRQAEMKANEAVQAAEPRSLSVSAPSPPVNLVIHAAPFKLGAEVESNGSLEPGKRLKIQLKIQRQNGFAGPVEIIAAGLDEETGISAEPLQLPADECEGCLTLIAGHEAMRGALPDLTIRAECDFAGRRSLIEVPVCVNVGRNDP